MMGKKLARGTPEKVNVSGELVWAYLDEIFQQDIHACLIEKDGMVIAEKAAPPYTLAYPHSVFSLTKTVSVMAMGYLVEAGEVGLEDTVIHYFPEYENSCTNDLIRLCTVRNLLTMSCGLPCANSDHDFYESSDWFAEFFSTTPLHRPGSYFEYDNRCAYMLSAIVTRVRGISVQELLQEKLFTPMEIDDIVWEEDAKHISQGGWGMSTSLETIAKYGRLLANDGVWNGTQLISRAWLDQCMSVQIATDRLEDYNKKFGYGYQIWRGAPADVWLARGAFGQLCIVCKQQNMVISLFAGMQNYNTVLDATWSFIKKVSEHPQMTALTRGSWQAKANRLNIHSLKIATAQEDQITLEVGSELFHLLAGHDTWVYNELPIKDFSPMTQVFWGKAACRSRWVDGRYQVEIAYLETPFTDTVVFSADVDELQMEYTCYPAIRIRGKSYTVGFSRVE